MSEYRWKGKDADDLTREEAIEAFKRAMDTILQLRDTRERLRELRR